MYNSDGYVLLDMSGIDLSLSSQYVNGLYNRVTKDCIDCNKLVIVINAGNLTPMAGVINKSLNYYVVTTELYIFKINTNDILIIEEAGSSTVEVAIVPTLLDGVKLADFQVGSTTGAIYAPEQQSEINDSVASDHTTYSSDKIDTLLSGKANTSDLATVATTGSYTDLSNKPTIPTKVSELQNDSGYVAGSSLATVATTGAYSDLTGTPTIPTKVSELQNDSGYITDSALVDYQTKTDSSLQTTADTVVGAINELNGDINNLYYKVGDTISSTIYKEMAGRLTNAGDKVLCFYPTYKYISASVQSVSLVLPSGNAGYIYTSVGGYPLKAGTYAGNITDGGIYFLIDLVTAQGTGGVGCTVEMSNRTITFS